MLALVGLLVVAACVSELGRIMRLGLGFEGQGDMNSSVCLEK